MGCKDGQSVSEMGTQGHLWRATPTPGTPRSRYLVLVLLVASISFLCIAPIAPLQGFLGQKANRNHDEPQFSHLAHHCEHIPPIQSHSFLSRQQSLATTLHLLGASAYIAEPGPSAAYFANLSGTSWRLSERPLLLVITPSIDEAGSVHAKVSVLTPSFEATRAKLLSIPSSSGITYPEWPEDVDPYVTALSVVPETLRGSVYVDSGARYFIVDGLKKASDRPVEIAPNKIKELRERKSKEELDILKCANEVTILSIREARRYMYLGMRESDAGVLVIKALTAAGLRGGFALTLFAENAALPHGSGTDRTLEKHDLILVDCGGALHGYQSDVTRTFALPDSDIPTHHMVLWNLVRSVQSSALDVATNGTITAHADRVARARMGTYAQYFTHRLGHGIGLEGHESPYLRGGTEDIILTGHTFSNEPGIYIEGQIGIRLEDCFYIDDEGKAVYLTEGVGGQARSPWDL